MFYARMFDLPKWKTKLMEYKFMSKESYAYITPRNKKNKEKIKYAKKYKLEV